MLISIGRISFSFDESKLNFHSEDIKLRGRGNIAERVKISLRGQIKIGILLGYQRKELSSFN